MRVKLKEDPKEWRKTALLTGLGVVLLGTILRWRGIIASQSWSLLVAVMVLVAISAWLRPRWYRGFYRVSTRIGFHLSQGIARVILALIFILLLAPLGLILRLTGNDPLQLRPRKNSPTYWHPAKESGPMDRLF